MSSSPDLLATDVEQRPRRAGVLHLGLGAFHRAHQMYFFDQLLEQGHKNWGVASVNLRSMAPVAALNAQDNVYCRWERGQRESEVRVIKAVTGSYHFPTQYADVMSLFCDPGIRLITVTVSEKGYHFDPTQKGLNQNDADIQDDHARPERPRTMPGVLCVGLEMRRIAGAGPITIISCDNYRDNGAVLRAVVTDFAKSHFPDLLSWIADNVRFPSSMVDGIVPSVRETDRAAFADHASTDDRALVIAEDYMRWVIQDDFIAERPPFEDVGVEIVPDVAVFEAMKLLLLNAPHSAISYLGHNAGFEFIHEAVCEPRLNNALSKLISAELLPIAMRHHKKKSSEYGSRTLDRFANPNIAYTTWQVATDGSFKIPERLLPALAAHLKEGRVPDGLALILAAWMRFVLGRKDSGDRYDVPDPLAPLFAETVCGLEQRPERIVDRLLSIRAIFPPWVSAHAELKHCISIHFAGLTDHGTLAWLDIISNAPTGRQQ